MDAPEAPPEADRAGDAPHPRMTAHLFGQAQAEEAFLSAHIAGRMHYRSTRCGQSHTGLAHRSLHALPRHR